MQDQPKKPNVTPKIALLSLSIKDFSKYFSLCCNTNRSSTLEVELYYCTKTELCMVIHILSMSANTKLLKKQ